MTTHMKYKVGDIVKVKPFDWFKTNCEYDFISGNGYLFDGGSYYLTDDMVKYCDKDVNIVSVSSTSYKIEGEDSCYWEDWMFETPNVNPVIQYICEKYNIELNRIFNIKDCPLDYRLTETGIQFYSDSLNSWVDDVTTFNKFIQILEEHDIGKFNIGDVYYTVDLTMESGYNLVVYEGTPYHEWLVEKGYLFKKKEEVQKFIADNFGEFYKEGEIK